MKELDRDELWRQLENAISLRSSQDSVLWQAFSLFLATNGVLLVALFTTGKFPTWEVAQIVAAVGMLMSGVWGLIQHRALARIKIFEHLLKDIDGKLFDGYDDKYSIGTALKKIRPPPRARHIMTLTVFITLFGWFLAFIFSIFLI